MSPLITTRAGASANAYGWGAAAGSSTAFESIATASGTGTTQTLTLSSIPSTFTHLQLRIFATASSGNCNVYLNNDSGTSYTRHWLRGGAALSANGAYPISSAFVGFPNGLNSSYPSVLIMDIFDYANTSKNKVVRTTSGAELTGGSSTMQMHSSWWSNTAAISSIVIYNSSAFFSANTRAALYGIKAAV